MTDGQVYFFFVAWINQDYYGLNLSETDMQHFVHESI